MKLAEIKQQRAGECYLESEDILEKKNLETALNNLICHLRDLSPSFQNHWIWCLVRLAANQAGINDQSAISFFTDLILSPYAKPIYWNEVLEQTIKLWITPAPTDPRWKNVSFRYTDPLLNLVKNFENMLTIWNKLVEILNWTEQLSLIQQYDEAFSELPEINPKTIQDYIRDRMNIISEIMPDLILDSNQDTPVSEVSPEKQWKYAIKSIFVDILKIILDGKEFNGFLIWDITHATIDKVKIRKTDMTEWIWKWIEWVFEEVTDLTNLDKVYYKTIATTKWWIIGVWTPYWNHKITFVRIVQGSTQKFFIFPRLTEFYAEEQIELIEKFVQDSEK